MTEKNNMTERIGEALAAAVSLTFADMSFLDVQPALDEDFSGSGQLLHISFSAPVPGGIMLQLPLDLKHQIVENIHAAPWDELNPTQIDDCLLELLNVLAGNFLQEMFGDEVKVNLSFPEVIFEKSEVDSVDRYRDYYYSAEGTSLVVSLYVETESGE